MKLNLLSKDLERDRGIMEWKLRLHRQLWGSMFPVYSVDMGSYNGMY